MRVKARAAEVRLRVSPATHAKGPAEATSLSSEDGSPAILATSRLVALMELAAARRMNPHLRDGESSVALSMNVTHVARTSVSGLVRAVATPGSISGRIHRFTIHAFDETGLIGSAEHTRAVVVEKKLLAVAHRRAGQPSLSQDF